MQAGSPPPYTDAILHLDRRVLLNQVARLGTIPIDRANSIVKDLTYPAAVNGVDPQDHPLLATQDGFLATIDRLVRGGGWEGALVRSLERLPWRREARAVLAKRRERLMQEWLESKVAHLAVKSRRNVAVGPKAERVGDIDLLLFRDSEEVALALSLKWLYEPNLVQEVASQSKRLQQAASQHERLLVAVGQDKERLATLHAFPANLVLLPAVVVHPGPVLQRVKNPSVPVVTSSEFGALAKAASSLAGIGEAMEEKQREIPALRISPREFRWWIGGYTFVTPGYYLRRREN